MPYSWPPTLAEAKAQTNISSSANDTELQSAIDAAVSILENHPEYRVKDAVASTTYTEWYDGGVNTIVLKHYPVISVTSVAEYSPTVQAIAAEPPDTTSAFTSYGYVLDADTGILTRTNAGYPTQFTAGARVKIVYVAGSATVPADAHLGALLLTEHIWQTQRGTTDSGLPSGLDADEVTTQFGPSFILPNRVRETLEAYRRTPTLA